MVHDVASAAAFWFVVFGAAGDGAVRRVVVPRCRAAIVRCQAHGSPDNDSGVGRVSGRASSGESGREETDPDHRERNVDRRSVVAPRKRKWWVRRACGR